MARTNFTALNVNASGTSAIHVGGDITAVDLLGINDIFLDDINSDGLNRVDMDDKLDMGNESLYSDSSQLNLNEGGVGTNVSVFGANSSYSGTEDDVEIEDDLNVQGTLTKGIDNFKINHPVDPDKYLYHSVIESDEMRNEYYGQIQIVNKKAIVTMPDWWHALNGIDKTEFNYQLTPIGIKADLWISKELENGIFEISSSIDCKISWKVSAIRHDKFAEENRMKVETFKNKAVIKRNPKLWMSSDLYEYDEESDTLYKISKKDLFLMKRKNIIESKKLIKELNDIKSERQQLNKDSKKFQIIGTPEQIKEKLFKRTKKEDLEIKNLKEGVETNRVKKKLCKQKLIVYADKMRKMNADWKLERYKKRGLIK